MYILWFKLKIIINEMIALSKRFYLIVYFRRYLYIEIASLTIITTYQNINTRMQFYNWILFWNCSEFAYATDGIVHNDPRKIYANDHLALGQHPWIIIDLQDQHNIKTIKVISRQDHILSNRFLQIHVSKFTEHYNYCVKFKKKLVLFISMAGEG